MQKKRLSRSIIVKFITVLLLYLSFSPILFGQNIDSLFLEFIKSKDVNKVGVANKFSKGLVELKYLMEERSFNKSDNTTELDAYVFSEMASYYTKQGKYEESIKLYEESIQLYKSIGDSLNICKFLQNLYVAYSVIGDYNKAFACLEESYPIALSLKNMKYIAYGQLALGDFYYRNKHFILAEEYFIKAYEHYTKLDNATMAIAALERLNSIYWELDKKEQITEIVYEVQKWKTSTISPAVRISIYMIESQAYKGPEKWDVALLYLDSCLMISESENMIDYTIGALTQISEICIMSGRNSRAEETLVRLQKLCVEFDRKTILQSVYRQLYFLKKESNPVESLKYLELYTFLSDSIYEQQMQEQLANLHVHYQTAEKEAQISLQQAELHKQNIQRTALLIGFALSIFFLVLLWYILYLRTKRNRVLAEMNAAKDKFFSIISHDLKNPAIAQRDALQMLLNHSDVWDMKTLSLYYDELLKSADGQVELLYNLLNWAQVQTGRMPYNPIQFDLVEGLRSDVILIENMSKRKGVSIDLNIPETAILTGDSNMTTTVVRNLLTNAVKFTPSGGTISLDIEPLPSKNNAFTITVSDTGMGMSDEQQRALFNLDHQSSRKGTIGESGSGLGLIVCKELVEKHGSVLHIESTENQGSRFWFVLSNFTHEK